MLELIFKYLSNYYKEEDVASIFGISKMEIKHSNFLEWILQPKKDDAVSYFPIRRLLKTLQNNISAVKKEYDFFLGVNLDALKIDEVQVMREKYNIDLLITFEAMLGITKDEYLPNEILNEKQKYLIVIENKIEAPERANQLFDYKNMINEMFPDYKKIFVLLHPNYEQLKQIDKNEELKLSAIKQNYISITYQDLYDNILKEYAQIAKSGETKFIINQYIHALSCFSSLKLNGLIITDIENKYLEEIFNNNKMKEFLSCVASKVRESVMLYQEHKEEFNTLFEKYKILRNFDNTNEVIQNINKILGKRNYYLNGQEYNTIYTFVYDILNDIIRTYNISTLDDLGAELKEILIGKDWVIHEWYDGIEKVWGGIIDSPIKIGDIDYYCASYISYSFLVNLCDLIFKQFPEYKEKIRF